MAIEQYRIIYDREEFDQLTEKAWELNMHSPCRIGIRRDVVTIESPGNGIDNIAEYLLGHLSSRPLRLTDGNEPSYPVKPNNSCMPGVPVYSEGRAIEHYDGNPALLLTLANRAVEKNLGILLHFNGVINPARYTDGFSGYLHIEPTSNLLYCVVETRATPEDGSDPVIRDTKAAQRLKDLETYLFADMKATVIQD